MPLFSDLHLIWQYLGAFLYYFSHARVRVCVCSHLRVCQVCGCVLAWFTDAHGHVEARNLPLSSVFHYYSLSYFWVTRSLKLSDSGKLAGQPPASTLQHSFYMGVQDQSSDPHTCMASSILTAQSLLKPFSLTVAPFTLTGASVPSFPTPTSSSFLYLSYFRISLPTS